MYEKNQLYGIMDYDTKVFTRKLVHKEMKMKKKMKKIMIIK